MSPKEIRELRNSLGMTQTDMAEYLGLRDKSQVAHLESGRTPAGGPTLRLLQILRQTGGELFRMAK